MIKSLAKFSIALAMVVGVSGCAADTSDDTSSEPDLVGQSHAALSSASTPKGAVPLYARATLDPVLGTVMVDVATTPLVPVGAPPSNDPHTDDAFKVVMVYIDRADGKRDVLRVLAGKQIGPGGGCIHFNVVAGVGDRLFLGGVVELEGTKGARVGIAPTVTVVLPGNWQDDPTVNLHPG